MTDQKKTVSEVSDAMTGYDEFKVDKAFGKPLAELGKSNTMALRVLVFVNELHNGSNDMQARETALSMPYKQVLDYFADEPKELMPEEPVTDAGKESSPLA